MVLRRGLYIKLIHGKRCYVYNYDGNVIISELNSREVFVNGKKHEIGTPFSDKKDFYVFCQETSYIN